MVTPHNIQPLNKWTKVEHRKFPILLSKSRKRHKQRLKLTERREINDKKARHHWIIDNQVYKKEIELKLEVEMEFVGSNELEE